VAACLKGALQLLINRYGKIRFAHVELHERILTMSFVILIIGNSKSNHLGAPSTFNLPINTFPLAGEPIFPQTNCVYPPNIQTIPRSPHRCGGTGFGSRASCSRLFWRDPCTLQSLCTYPPKQSPVPHTGSAALGSVRVRLVPAFSGATHALFSLFARIHPNNPLFPTQVQQHWARSACV